MKFVEIIEKFNPNHDGQGRFSSATGAMLMAFGDSPAGKKTMQNYQNKGKQNPDGASTGGGSNATGGKASSVYEKHPTLRPRIVDRIENISNDATEWKPFLASGNGRDVKAYKMGFPNTDELIWMIHPQDGYIKHDYPKNIKTRDQAKEWIYNFLENGIEITPQQRWISQG